LLRQVDGRLVFVEADLARGERGLQPLELGLESFGVFANQLPVQEDRDLVIPLRRASRVVVPLRRNEQSTNAAVRLNPRSEDTEVELPDLMLLEEELQAILQSLRAVLVRVLEPFEPADLLGAGLRADLHHLDHGAVAAHLSITFRAQIVEPLFD